MARRPNYFALGLFTIAAAALLLAAVVMWGSGLITEQKILFETYIDGSVHGLRIGSPIEYRGVEIGRVEQIGFAANEYDIPIDPNSFSQQEGYVLVVGSVQEEYFPALSEQRLKAELPRLISHGLRIRLASQILTGVAYIELNYLDPDRFPVTEVGWTPKHPYIPSAPSMVSTLKDSVDQVLERLKDIDVQRIGAAAESLFVTLEKTIVDANVPQVTAEARQLLAEARDKLDKIDTEGISNEAERALAAVRTTVEDANFPALSRQAEQLFAEAGQAARDLQSLLAKPEKDAELANLALAVAQLNRTLQRVDTLFVRQTPQIEQILNNFRDVSENLKELSRRLEQHPAGTVLSTPPRKPEALK